MNVLSLFDGMSCGQIALERAGIKVDKYYRAEIDKYANIIAKKNYPDSIDLGDIQSIINIPDIDLLIGGSPCQGFSSSGLQLNFDDPKSKLFFEYVRILKASKPKYFLLENVAMRKEWEDIITSFLGVRPIKIDSCLVSAQIRKRNYWTNIPGVGQPEDKDVKLETILESKEFLHPVAIRGRRLLNGSIVGRRLNKEGKREDNNKLIPIKQCLEVRKMNPNKSNCLTTVAKDNVLTCLEPGRYPDAFKRGLPFRYYTKKELARLQTMPEHWFNEVSQNQAVKLSGNGWTIDVIAHIFQGIKNN